MTIEEDILGQTIAEVDTLSGWTAHYGGIRVTAVTDDGHTALVADGWGHPHRTLLAALNRHARQHMGGCGLDGHWPGPGRPGDHIRETWARRLPLPDVPPVYAQVADGWRLQLDVCPLDADAFQVTVLDHGTTPDTTQPEEAS